MKELESVAVIMESTRSPWAICGGWAVDLFLGKVTRLHKDVDVAIPRRNQLQVQARLLDLGWTLAVAHKGELTPWGENEFLELPRHAIWARRGDEFFELLLNEWTETEFFYRRDHRISRPVEQAIQVRNRIPFLAPEVVLLYKSIEFENPINRADLAAALPNLDGEQKNWLRRTLALSASNHPWLKCVLHPE